MSAMKLTLPPIRETAKDCDVSVYNTVADPGENLTGALHSNFGRGGCG